MAPAPVPGNLVVTDGFGAACAFFRSGMWKLPPGAMLDASGIASLNVRADLVSRMSEFRNNYFFIKEYFHFELEWKHSFT